MFEAVDVGGAQAEFSLARAKDYAIPTVDFLKFFGDRLRSIRAIVVDDDDFVVETAFFEALCDQPDDERQVLAFVVGGKENGVLIRRRRCFSHFLLTTHA